MSKKEYCVYRYWSPSNKSYIGQTCQGIDARAGRDGSGYWSCPYFYSAIQKYGWNWFKQHRQILAADLTHEEADRIEQDSIEKFNSKVPNGYNIQEGGTYNTRALFIKPVVGINCFTKEKIFFDSIAEAKKTIGIKSTKISAAILHRQGFRTAGGFVWISLEEYNSLTKEEKKELYDVMPALHSKSWEKYSYIVRLNDGKRYKNLTEAAKDNHVYPGNIGKCLRGQIKSTGKMPDGTYIHWKRVFKDGVDANVYVNS